MRYIEMQLIADPHVFVPIAVGLASDIANPRQLGDHLRQRQVSGALPFQPRHLLRSFRLSSLAPRLGRSWRGGGLWLRLWNGLLASLDRRGIPADVSYQPGPLGLLSPALRRGLGVAGGAAASGLGFGTGFSRPLIAVASRLMCRTSLGPSVFSIQPCAAAWA